MVLIMETEIGWSEEGKNRVEDEKQRKQRYEEGKKRFEEEKQRKQRYEELKKKRFEEEKEYRKHKKPREKCLMSYGNIEDADPDMIHITEEERSGKVCCQLYKFYKGFTLDGFTEEGFISDMERYDNDMKHSDGFDVGVYPHRRDSGLFASHFVSLYYNPSINHNLPQACVDDLLCLSNLAISLYNMNQPTPTYYDSVNVLKAMNFGCMASNYNITFQASLPPAPAQLPATTFQTRVLTLSLFRVFQIVFVRKLNGDDEYQANSLPSQHVDVIGDQNLSHFHHSDDDSGFKLPLYLSQFALHMLNSDQLHLEIDKLLQTVNVLDTKKSLLCAPEEGAAYLITFEAFLPYKRIIQTKIYLSPLVPPATIKIMSVKVLTPPN